MPKVREPIKKTSIAKKRKIVKKGFELMCQKGYHHITCADIAKYAGVSTGSIYQYFYSKKDILIAGINEYLTEIMFPKITKEKFQDKEAMIQELINSSIENHKKYKVQHEELVSIIHQDKELSKLYQEKEWEVTKSLAEFLKKDNKSQENILEKAHIILDLIDNLSHEVIYHKHKDLKEEILTDETAKIIIKILK